jgi:DNA-directed RNA polymerase subunit N (RpoN/RPB10)
MIPAAYIFKPICSCSKQLGSLQKDFEERTRAKLPFDVATDMGLTRMCCRNSVLNSSLYFIKASDIGRIIDECGHIEKHSTSIDSNPDVKYSEDSKPCIFSKPVPDFPLLPGETRFEAVRSDIVISDAVTDAPTYAQIHGIGGFKDPEEQVSLIKPSIINLGLQPQDPRLQLLNGGIPASLPIFQDGEAPPTF